MVAGSPQSVNLSAERRKAIMTAQCVKVTNFGGAWPSGLFDEAMAEQYAEINSYLPEFSRSAIFTAADQEMGSYNAQMLFHHLPSREFDEVRATLARRLTQLAAVSSEDVLMA